MGPAEVRSTGDTTFVLERKNTGISDISTEETTQTQQATQASQAQAPSSSGPVQGPELPPQLASKTSTQTSQAPTSAPEVSAQAPKQAPPSDTPLQSPVMANPTTAAAPSATSDKHEMVCPDPTAHRDTKLQEQASTAALYVTRNAKSTDPAKDGILDANNKLSSRSAAASLKYANPQDLPSFPVVGINTAGSANSAANLANNNQKPFEHWKPDPSTSASAAAMAAKDYKMAPLWKPELSAAGSKAALLAHKDGGKLNLWQPQASAEGNSAAHLAMRNNTLSPKLDYGYTEDGHKKALMAATGALGKSQSFKAPPPANPAYPDSANSAHNALNAATVAHRPSSAKPVPDSNRIDSDAMRAARVQNMGPNVPREMFGSAPPVELEVEEKKKQAALRASAISMAKQMYDTTEKKRKEQEAAEISGRIGTSAATSVHNRAASSSTTDGPDLRTQAMQYIHLQEAAQKLAAERLAKMDPDGVARYRSHYGYEPQSPRSRLSLRKKPSRGRAESNPKQQEHDDDDSSDDEFRSRRIRHQMANLNDSVNQQDQKRNQDRAALLAAAEKKVQAQMHNMDERVFAETGKVTPAMMEEWEAKARARAAADSENRQRNFGKVAIGGGKFMDQSELDAIAQSRLQPTLNEISETAEKKRARDEEIRLDQEERQRQFKSEREKEKEVKAEQKRLRDNDKNEAKTARKMEKEAEKARKAEEKQKRKEEKQRTKEAKKEAAEAASASAAAHEAKQKEVAPAATTNDTTTTTAAAPVVTPDADKDVDADATPAIATPERVVDTDGAPLSTTDSPDMLTHVRTGGSQHTTPSGMRPELDRHITTVSTSDSSSSTSLSGTSDEEGDARPTATEPTPVGATSVGATTAETPTRRKSGRFSGIFSRFRTKSKAGETQRPATSSDNKRTTSTAEPTTAISTTEPSSTTTTAAPIVATAAVPAAPTSDAASESSFRRHQADLHSISSVSSFEHAVINRGRTSGVSDDEDEFEEARDNFDETLAPPPNFGGQLKSESPARETKFQEEL